MQRTTLLRATSIFLLLIGAIGSHAQNEFKQTYDFLQHLNKLEAYDEGVFYINEKLSEFTGSQLDTLYYMKGYFNYSMKEINPSIESFRKVSNSSGRIYVRAQFLKAFQQAYVGNLEGAKQLVLLDVDTSSFLNELKYLALGSVALLERDLAAFDKYQQNFSGDYYQLSKTEERLRLNKEGLLNVKRKSPLAAGLLSGIVPGAGKFYVGKAGEGYLTLLISAILGLQMREAYTKDGIESTRFKVYGGIFSAIYVANIWGSVVSVKTYRNEINDTYDEAILLNMHVPLRTIFD